MNRSGERLSAYGRSAALLHDHLANRMDPVSGFPDRPSWGYAFSLLLSASVGGGDLTSLGEHALRHLAAQDHDDPNYSWEFVVYAIQKTKQLVSPDLSLPCDVHRVKGTRMFNWFLLRQLNQTWFSERRSLLLVKLRIARSLYTNRQGLIVDEFRTRSMQYHAFCLFLISEMVEQHPEVPFLRDWLWRGTQFAVNHILHDGAALWLGRGQEQIFGYGALLYALEYVHRNIGRLPEEKLERLRTHVLSFQRPDGSFPLVLRRRQPEDAETDFGSHPPGWYGYNTLYDYQPFLAYTLWRAASLGALRP